jgi:hypothetical protein
MCQGLTWPKCRGRLSSAIVTWLTMACLATACASQITQNAQAASKAHYTSAQVRYAFAKAGIMLGTSSTGLSVPFISGNASTYDVIVFLGTSAGIFQSKHWLQLARTWSLEGQPQAQLANIYLDVQFYTDTPLAHHRMRPMPSAVRRAITALTVEPHGSR